MNLSYIVKVFIWSFFKIISTEILGGFKGTSIQVIVVYVQLRLGPLFQTLHVPFPKPFVRRPFISLSVCKLFTISVFFLYKYISSKLDKKDPWVKGIRVCSNDGQCPFPEEKIAVY